MNQPIFTPQNELETQLMAALDGSMAGEDFIHHLMAAQVFMPIQERPVRSRASNAPLKPNRC